MNDWIYLVVEWYSGDSIPCEFTAFGSIDEADGFIRKNAKLVETEYGFGWFNEHGRQLTLQPTVFQHQKSLV